MLPVSSLFMMARPCIPLPRRLGAAWPAQQPRLRRSPSPACQSSGDPAAAETPVSSREPTDQRDHPTGPQRAAADHVSLRALRPDVQPAAHARQRVTAIALHTVPPQSVLLTPQHPGRVSRHRLVLCLFQATACRGPFHQSGPAGLPLQHRACPGCSCGSRCIWLCMDVSKTKESKHDATRLEENVREQGSSQ